MKNAGQYQEVLNERLRVIEVESKGQGFVDFRPFITEVMRDVLTECQAIATKVMQSPRTEILNIQPGEAKVMTPMDCWVKACQSIIQRVETLKGAQ